MAATDAPDTDLAGYPANLKTRYPAGYPAQNRDNYRSKIKHAGNFIRQDL
jgi:hypothetical protein